MPYIVPMKNVPAFITCCKRFLKVKRPIVLEIVDGDSTPDGFDASHCFENGSHFIEVAANASRGFLSVLAHEIVHASVDEQAPRAKWHGFAFQVRAQRLEEHLKAQGYDVHKIFWLGVDK